MGVLSSDGAPISFNRKAVNMSSITQVLDSNGNPLSTLDQKGDLTLTGDITIGTTSTPGIPASGSVTLYSDGTKLNMVDSTGAQTQVSSGGTNTSFPNISVTGNALGIPTPANIGYVAWTADPATVTGGQLATNGTVYLASVYIPVATTLTKLSWGTGTTGITATSGQNFVGLYNSAGTRLASVNVDTHATATAGLFTETISVAVTPGHYWVGFVFNCSTAPSPYRNNFVNGTLVNGSVVSAGNLRYATNGTSQTSLPTSITPSSNTASQSTYFAMVA